jgi:hypothetical protein
MRSLPRGLAFLLAFGTGCSANDPGDSSVTLQPVTFADLRQTVAGLHGKVAVLDFWADY